MTTDNFSIHVRKLIAFSIQKLYEQNGRHSTGMLAWRQASRNHIVYHAVDACESLPFCEKV
jgi:hypothetical protein